MEQNLNLNFTDIADLVKIIDYACHEGAFKGWDTIRPVLAKRDKVQAFVEAAQAEMEAQQKAQEETEEVVGEIEVVDDETYDQAD